jgi:hypothetical protein
VTLAIRRRGHYYYDSEPKPARAGNMNKTWLSPVRHHNSVLATSPPRTRLLLRNNRTVNPAHATAYAVRYARVSLSRGVNTYRCYHHCRGVEIPLVSRTLQAGKQQHPYSSNSSSTPRQSKRRCLMITLHLMACTSPTPTELTPLLPLDTATHNPTHNEGNLLAQDSASRRHPCMHPTKVDRFRRAMQPLHPHTPPA